MSKSAEYPSTWCFSLLGEVIEYGKTEKVEPRAISPDSWVVELEDIEKGTSKLLQRMTFGQRQSKSTKNRFLIGDVLYGKLRPYLNKVLIADSDGYSSTEILPLRSTKIIDGRYLYFWLKHPDFLNYVTDVSHGLNMPRLGTEAGMKAPIVLAPFNEQKRIANKLDGLLKQVDACREKLDRVPLILKRFRQAVLAAATSGALTEDWRETSKLTAKNISLDMAIIRAEKWGRRGKYKPAITAKDVDSIEFKNLPPSWYRSTLDEITWSVKDGPHFSPKYEDDGIPFISGGSIKPGRIDLSIGKFISSQLHAELSMRCKPEPLDILYTKGGTTGLAAVNILQEDFNVWVHVAVLKLVSEDLINPFFIQHALNSPECYSQSQRYTHGVGNQDLGLTRMIKIVIPVPPIEEQHEIIRRVEKLLSFADRLEARCTTARKQVDQLTPSLLAKAFRGELVERDPNDEPAAVLLERIKAEREGQGAARPTRGRKRKTAD